MPCEPRMKRVQRPQRDLKPRPAVPPATSNRKPAKRPGKPTVAAKDAARVAGPAPAGAIPTSAKPKGRAAKAHPVEVPADAQAGKPAAPPMPPATPAGSEAQVVNKPPRRGLGNLGRQSLHRQQPTITLAVERPRALPLPETSAYRSGPSFPASAKASGKAGSAGASTASLLQLREGLRGLLSLLDAPPAATAVAEKM